MKTITIENLRIQFDADSITHGTPEEQAAEALSQINGILSREPLGLGAQVLALEQLDVTTTDDLEENSLTMGYHDLSDEFWDSLSPQQQAELHRERKQQL